MNFRVRWPSMAIVPFFTLLAMAAMGSLAFAASKPSPEVNADHPLEIWVDPPRIPAVKAFEKAYPDIPIHVNTLNSSASNTGLQAKFNLMNRVGGGWPDAIFWPNNSAIAWAAGPDSQINYAADLTKLLPSKVINGYSAATISPCVIDGKWYCLRNDVAPTVLWYNVKLFDTWGYTPPTTWPEYEALGLKIAKDHPGYYVGLAGDIYTPDRYLWPSGCPTNQVSSGNNVTINVQAESCTRVRDMMDKLLSAGVLSPDGIFSSAAGSTVGPKLAMTPGAAWYGNYLFRDTFKIPAGEMTAAPPLQWPGVAAGTGDEGGGLWSMSRYVTGQRQQDALKFMEFMATSPAWQVDLSTGLPAYGPDQQPWIDKQCAANYFAKCDQLGQALIAAANEIRTNHQYLLYSSGQVWTETVAPGLTAGKSLASLWPAFQSSLVNHAKVVGYKVTTK